MTGRGSNYHRRLDQERWRRVRVVVFKRDGYRCCKAVALPASDSNATTSSPCGPTLHRTPTTKPVSRPCARPVTTKSPVPRYAGKVYLAGPGAAGVEGA